MTHFEKEAFALIAADKVKADAMLVASALSLKNREFLNRNKYLFLFIIQFIILGALFFIIPSISKLDVSQQFVLSNLSALHVQIKDMVQKDSTMKSQLQHYPAALPIAAANISKVTSIYDERIDPMSGKKKFHYGIDYSASLGTPVYATADGKIETAGNIVGFGQTVKIDHLNEYESLYGHLSMIMVKKDQIVLRGDLIGLIGSTGKSTGNHLHYEIFYNYKPINPDIFIKPLV